LSVPDLPPTSDLRYHDYIALLTWLEEAQAVRVANPAPSVGASQSLHTQVIHDFTWACADYARGVERNRKAFDTANGHPENTTPSLARFLYNPASFLAWGHSDAVGLVLLDDLDPAFAILSDIQSPVDQSTIAFVPCMDSLGLAEAAFRDRSRCGKLFCELEEFFTSDPPWFPEAGVVPPVPHNFQIETPLFVVTRFKLGGMAVLGQGQLLLQAIFRAIAGQMNKVLSGLWKSASTSQGDDLEITRDDLRRVKVTFLDGQGSEDLVTLIACNNYSLAISLVTRIRCLTFGEVFAVDPRLPHLLDVGDVPLHRGLYCVHQIETGKKPKSRPELGDYRDNHVFAASYTTLAASRTAFETGVNCHGLVEVHLAVDSNPGHLAGIERALLEVYARLVEATGGLLVHRTRSRFRDFHRFAVGRHDYLLSLAPDPNTTDLVALPLPHFFAFVRAVFDELGKGDPARPGGVRETGLMDLSSALVIPFPELRLIPDVGPRHFPLMDVLYAIRRRLFAAVAPGEAKPLFDPRLLQDSLRALGIPWSLSRTVLYVYQDFARALSDPLLFPAVLDLYDPLATLYKFLTQDLVLQQIIFRDPNTARELPTPCGEDVIDALNGLLDAIQNAVMHRVTIMPQATEVRDLAIDLRGGLNKLVAAADVPLKCGLYLLKLSMKDASHGGQGRSSPGALPADQVGAVMRLTFHPRTTCHALQISGPSPRCLAHVHMHVAAIARPEQFVALFHEAAHLLEEVDGEPLLAGGAAGSRAALAERAEEVFAGLLTHLLVFATDGELYLRHTIASYSIQPKSAGIMGSGRLSATEVTRTRFFEVVFRAFLVAEPIRRAAGESTDPLCWPEDHYPLNGFAEGANLADMSAAFVNMVERVGPFFWDYAAWHREGPGVLREQFEKGFDALFPHVVPHMARVWRLALRAYKRLFTQAGSGRRADLVRLVGAALKEGRPLLYGPGVGDSIPAVAPFHDQASRLERVRLVCELIREYVSFCYGGLEIERGLHLRRRPSDGSVNLTAETEGGAGGRSLPPGDGESRGWNDFQIDRSHGQLFCAHPVRRRERLQREIVILKTLWNLSTYLRGERLYRILVDGWPAIAAP
jgi:hypothetical protein